MDFRPDDIGGDDEGVPVRVDLHVAVLLHEGMAIHGSNRRWFRPMSWTSCTKVRRLQLESAWSPATPEMGRTTQRRPTTCCTSMARAPPSAFRAAPLLVVGAGASVVRRLGEANTVGPPARLAGMPGRARALGPRGGLDAREGPSCFGTPPCRRRWWGSLWYCGRPSARARCSTTERCPDGMSFLVDFACDPPLHRSEGGTPPRDAPIGATYGGCPCGFPLLSVLPLL